MVQVHTTFFEDPIEVEPDEAEFLRLQGLLRDDQPAAAAKAGAADPAQKTPAAAEAVKAAPGKDQA